MTNVNFDSQRMIEYLQDAVKYRAEAKALYEKAARRKGVAVRSFAASDHPTNMQLAGSTKEALERQGHTVGVLERRDRSGNPDLSGLIELSTYGLKGTAAYAHHALVLKQTSEEVFAEVHRVLYELSDPELTVDRALKLSLDVGGLNLKVMELLDRGGTSRYGHPTPTQVRTTPVKGKAILVSGHDLRDLELILEQTAGKGINVYTHGEMLPAHGYPKLRAFPHLAGHYGGAWQLQKFEFGNFPGPIIMTTNCIIEPRQSYKHRIFTRSVVGWPGVSHIEGDDMSAVVRAAMETPGFEETEQKAAFLTTGFARNAILGVADKVVQAVKDKKISRFFVIGGCDGSEAERNYFKDLALATPKDSVILTLGCAKYRFNRLPLGNVPGLDLPRLLDCGQCNDAYSAIAVASALANAFKTDVNSLPLSLNLSWLEQKACAVLLTLLHLGIKNIRLGPNLPAFATPNMLNILSSKFNLMPVGNVAEDLANMQAGK
jgi:hydroxylamine reductase